MRSRFVAFAAAILLLSAAPSRGASIDLMGLLEGQGFSEAHAISADGQIAVGESGQAMVWTRARGLEVLPLPSEWTFILSRANAVSPDGSTIVGDGVVSMDSSDPRRLPIVWRRSADAYEVATPDDLIDYALGTAVPWHVSLIDVSADGTAVLGNAEYAGGFVLGNSFRWDPAGGFEYFSTHRIVAGSDDMTILGGYEVENDREVVRLAASNTTLGGGLPFDVSDSGSAIVGWLYDEAFEHESAFRWTVSDGLEFLGALEGDMDGHAQATSTDGAIVVGRSGSSNGGFHFHAAFLWDAANGMRSLQDMLEERLGEPFEGWTLVEATDVTPDGRFVVGNARDSEGTFEGFVADLPEPSRASGALAISGLLAVLRVRAARRAR